MTMPAPLSSSPLSLDRDGVSQAQRRLPALAPDFVAVDERTPRDWLALAAAFSRELRYFDQNDRPSGDWSGFLNPQGLTGAEWTAWLDRAAAFLEAPESVADAELDGFRRPHFVLFLAFLQLLRRAQVPLNALTGRHLDFYYRDVLRLLEKPAQPDRVHLLIKAAPTVERGLLAAGTLLDAGRDSQGKDLAYRTDTDLVFNHADVAQLRSLYLDRRIIGIREAREQYPGPKADGVVEMLKIALGDPEPGDDLPHYPPKGLAVDFALLEQLHGLVRFIGTGLHLEPWELRSLMELKHRRAQADADWQRINAILELAGQARTTPAFKLDPADPRDFDANLAKAEGGPVDLSGLKDLGIHTLGDLYDQRTHELAQGFITKDLHLSLSQFVTMMQIKVRIDGEWREINGLLERAGQRERRDPSYRLGLTDPASPAFDANFQSALGTPDFAALDGIAPISDLEGFAAAVSALEGYFRMAAEDFASMMATAEQEVAGAAGAPAPAWDRVYGQLANAYTKKVYAERRARLRALQPKADDSPDARGAALQAMVSLVLGGVVQADDRLARLQAYLPTDQDVASLESALKGASLSADQWDQVAATLELAWRNREGSAPVAQKIEWLGLYAAEDVTRSQVPGTADPPRWRTFGQLAQAPARDHPPAAILGWAISSPLLCLAQGQRTISLTLGFQPASFDAAKLITLEAAPPLQAQLSSAQGWIAPTQTRWSSPGDYKTLVALPADATEPTNGLMAMRCDLTLDAAAPAIAPPPGTDSAVTGPWPVLRLLLAPRWDGDAGRYRIDYPPFYALTLERIRLQVAVAGLSDLTIRNDDVSLDAKAPFEPFGSSPAPGARLDLGHPELAVKRLDSLGFQLQWMGAPKDLGTHYKNYEKDDGTSLGATNASFTVSISSMSQARAAVLEKAAPLFETSDAGADHAIEIPSMPDAAPGPVPELPSGDDLRSWGRYLRWELNPPDFQHSAYPAVATAKSIELATAIAGGDKPSADDYKLKPPYTPKLKRLTLDYGSSVEIDMSAYPGGEAAERVFHRHPFGFAEIQPEGNSGRYALLPDYQNEGELYIGLKDLQAPETLALLMEMAEGSADPDLTPTPVAWSYLSGNRWTGLQDGHLLGDSTQGLIQSGILQFQLEAALPNSLLPADSYWLRAAAPRQVRSLCDTIAIHTQAVAATFVDRDNAADHLSQPLAAKTITKTLEPLPDIAAVLQPYTSFGGSPAESDATFSTRVSERLRHKQRAISPWDYERLVLERFPQIYKVKCLQAVSPSTPDDLGRLDVVVIPDIRNQRPLDPFEPKAPAGLIEDITSFLRAHAPPFAEVRVKNAHFVPVKLRFAVRFLPGRDPGYYRPKLNDDVNRFLLPWAFGEGTDIQIGGTIYANAIVDFIERRPYVDYVAQLKLFASDDGVSFRPVEPPPPNSTEGYAVRTDRPDGVLIAALQHEIDLITENKLVEALLTGIDYMKIELDFIVG